MGKRLTLLLVCGMMWMSGQAQHDPIFSQFYAAPLQINPAFAGVTFEPRINANYRNQYPNWPEAYVTYSLSYEQSIEGLNSAIGLMLTTDSQGDGIYKTNAFSAIYGYRIKVNDQLFLRMGIEVGLIQETFDWDRLVFGDQLDDITGEVGPDGLPIFSEEIRPLSLNGINFDAGTGILLYSDAFYAGLSVKHLNRYYESQLDVNENLFAGQPMRFSVHAGTNVTLGARNNRAPASFISPNVLLVKQADFAQVNAGAYLGYGRLYGGAWYRHTFGNADAAIFLIGMREGIFRIGYSYDATLSNLSSIPGGLGGTHEFSVALTFGDSRSLQRKRRQNRYLNCFNMFN